MSRRRAAGDEVRVYLRHLVTEELKKQGVSARGLAAQLKISHPTVLDIRSGVNELTNALMVEKLASYFGLDMPSLYERAREFVDAHPEALRGKAETQTEPLEGAPASLGALPGWTEAEARARQLYARVLGGLSEADWVAIRRISGMRAPSPVTPEFVLNLAVFCLSNAALLPPSDEEAEALASEHERGRDLERRLNRKRTE